MEYLVIIDMQNDFIDGSLGTGEAVAIVPDVVKLIENWKGGSIFVTKDTHQPEYLSTLEGVKLPVIHCVRDTDGWELNPQIQAALETKKSTRVVMIDKPTFGSECLVDVIKALVKEGDQIILAGLCTDICVVSNALLLRAALPDTVIRVIGSCCAGVTPATHDAALQVMGMCQIDVE